MGSLGKRWWPASLQGPSNFLSGQRLHGGHKEWVRIVVTHDTCIAFSSISRDLMSRSYGVGMQLHWNNVNELPRT